MRESPDSLRLKRAADFFQALSIHPSSELINGCPIGRFWTRGMPYAADMVLPKVWRDGIMNYSHQLRSLKKHMNFVKL